MVRGGQAGKILASSLDNVLPYQLVLQFLFDEGSIFEHTDQLEWSIQDLVASLKSADAIFQQSPCAAVNPLTFHDLGNKSPLESQQNNLNHKKYHSQPPSIHASDHRSYHSSTSAFPAL